MIRRIFRAIKNRKRKQRSKTYRYANRILSTLCVAYVLLLFFPHPLFAHSTRVGQFHFHSDRPISPEIEAIVQQATASLATSPLYTDTASFDVYIAADDWRRTLLLPRAHAAFGANMILTGNIILNRCDIKNDVCTSDQPDFNRRPMHAVLAHECMHQLLASDLGLPSYFCLPTWKNEGYCEYVAGHPSFEVLRGQTLLRNGESHASHSFRYLTYLIAVRSCIDDQAMEPRQFFSQPLDFQTVLDESIQ